MVIRLDRHNVEHGNVSLSFPSARHGTLLGELTEYAGEYRASDIVDHARNKPTI
jgi:hypothetical protein